jgi:hypothetical protein
MRTLLRLYPAAWRERYGDEVAALLEEHPPTLLDHLDLIRGALDARLHPQVPGAAAAPDKELPVNQRLLGVMAAIGGLAWLIGFASLLVMPLDEYGFPDASIAIIAAALASSFIGIALGELGTREGSATSRRTGHVIAVASVAAAVTMFIPWPVFVIGLYAFPIIGILAAARGALNGTFPGWFGAVFAIASLASMVGYLGGTGQQAAVVLMAALGPAGLALAWLALRGRAVSAPEVGPA